LPLTKTLWNPNLLQIYLVSFLFNAASVDASVFLDGTFIFIYMNEAVKVWWYAGTAMSLFSRPVVPPHAK
jgi:hypothetical protein